MILGDEPLISEVVLSHPPPRVLTRDVTPTGRSGFHALVGPLREVKWSAKFKASHIDRYDGSSNPKDFIQVYHSWDQLCAMFIENFQGTYERPSTTETLKTIKQKHDESLRDYVKRFYNARNGILYIQDIEIINAF
jgi:hypothetical protein